jgi:hypothetical protein
MNQEHWNLLLIALAQRTYELEQRVITLELQDGRKADCLNTWQCAECAKQSVPGVLPGAGSRTG